jgi:glycosyltransferase involved in cell wall biosynthesis
LKLRIAISIIAYNEQQTIEPLVRECDRVLRDRCDDFEIIVIDDGSLDQTADILESVQTQLPKMRLQRHGRNLGFGPTLRDAFLIPTMDWIFLLPGDGQISPHEIDRLIPATAEADIVIGWRRDRQDARIRALISGVYNLVISAFLRRRIHDIDSVVLLKRSVFRKFQLKSNSAFIHAELILRAHGAGIRWVEQTINHQPRISGSSGAFRAKVMVAAFRDLVKYLSS